MDNSPNEAFRLAIAAGVAMIILMAGFIVLFLIVYKRKQDKQRSLVRDLEEQHQKELLEASLRSQEVEAQRIAADLHDDIGTLLSATRMSFSLVTRHVDDTQESRESVEQTKKLLEEAVENVRKLTKDLQPPALEKLGLAIALQELVRKLQQANPALAIEFEQEGMQGDRLEKAIELTLYRVAQELLHNSLKHARADRIDVHLIRQKQRLLFTLADDGVGYDPQEVQLRGANAGLGLKNIESRLNVVGGHVIFETSPGKGTLAIVDIPLPLEQR